MAFPKKISELPIAPAIKNTDLFVLVHDGVTSQITKDRLIFSADTNTFLTGGTLNGDILTLTLNDNVNINIDGFSNQFTGNTSGDCINELWVSTISGCSPVVIGPEVIINGLSISGMAVGTNFSSGLTATTIINLTTEDYFVGVTESTGNVHYRLPDVGHTKNGQILTFFRDISGSTNTTTIATFNDAGTQRIVDTTTVGNYNMIDMEGTNCTVTLIYIDMVEKWYTISKEGTLHYGFIA